MNNFIKTLINVLSQNENPKRSRNLLSSELITVNKPIINSDDRGENILLNIIPLTEIKRLRK